ncbi:MAG TPA: SpoIIE family protein phosphatase [Bacteroidia bacterium]|jgi:PAS domain S-box-containing protein|nr:SpoIIE family protein phosphatase [Bacteroidia bacterium]
MNNIGNIVFIISGAFAAFAIFQLARSLKLKKENRSYEQLFQHINDTLLLIDIIDGKIMYANEAAQKMLGYPLAELTNKTIFNIHSKDQLARSSEVIATVYEKKGLIYSDLPFISATGERIDVECSAKVEDFAGKVVIFISARDIRERLRLQAQIKQQSNIIEQKNKDLIDSITYAKNIQHAILPSLSLMQQSFPEMFVLYKPKDIVSGDFYWHTSVRSSVNNDLASTGARLDVISVVDCTGHGVPGAFMSLVGYTILNQTVNSPEVNTPGAVLDYMNREVVQTLNKKMDEIVINDGMDMSVCAFNPQTMKLNYAGANHLMYHIRGNIVTSYDGDKQAIGLQSQEQLKAFTNHELTIEKGDVIYMFTDGFEDQFGGDKNKKYMSSRFKEYLLSIHSHEMPEQQKMLEKEFLGWKRNNEQLDDVLVIGIRF